MDCDPHMWKPWKDIFSRPLGGRLCSTKFIREKLGTFETFTISVVGLGLVSFFAPFYVTNFASFAVYGILFGLCFGLTIGVEWSNVAELVETDILSDAITFIQVSFLFVKVRKMLLARNLDWNTFCDLLRRLDFWWNWRLCIRLLHCRCTSSFRLSITTKYCFMWKKLDTNSFSGAACAGIVAIRRRCSFGEMYEEEVGLPSKGPSLLVTPAEVSFR